MKINKYCFLIIIGVALALLVYSGNQKSRIAKVKKEIKIEKVNLKSPLLNKGPDGVVSHEIDLNFKESVKKLDLVTLQNGHLKFCYPKNVSLCRSKCEKKIEESGEESCWYQVEVKISENECLTKKSNCLKNIREVSVNDLDEYFTKIESDEILLNEEFQTKVAILDVNSKRKFLNCLAKRAQKLSDEQEALDSCYEFSL